MDVLVDGKGGAVDEVRILLSVSIFSTLILPHRDAGYPTETGNIHDTFGFD